MVGAFVVEWLYLQEKLKEVAKRINEKDYIVSFYWLSYNNIKIKWEHTNLMLRV